MRPIDDLREKIDLWKKSTTDIVLMSVLNDVLKQIDVAIYEMDHQEAESTWHRVEEPPEMKETKELPGFFMSGLCALFDRHSKVFDLGYATKSNYMGGGIKWHSVYATRPTHWMPIEPPKEGNQ